MRKIAKATNPGRCAYAKCPKPGDHIFEHRGWRFLACSMKCALIAHHELEKIPEDLRPILFDKKIPKKQRLKAIEEYRGKIGW